MVLRLYGLENLQVYIRNRIELAWKFEELVKNDTRFEVMMLQVDLFFMSRGVADISSENNGSGQRGGTVE